ncbi:hypothetical protein BU17DRAFT_37949, partial [Hysterangium stoloniferum]
SFVFQWPRFSDEFHRDARAMLEAALNKGNKPPIIADKIEVIELEMGTQPPELQIREIGDLTLDQFRGIFRLSYEGDAHIVLKTKIFIYTSQANPLNHKKPDIHMIGGSRGMLAAHQPLVVPMLLRLSHFVLNGYVVLVVSKQKGITIVFKTDPLQNVDVNSTFDSIAVIQNYIQREIEGQLREMFREDLPAIIHRLSQRWVAGKTKVEAPYLSKRPRPRPVSEYQDSMSALDTSPASLRYATSLPGLQSNAKRSLSNKPSMQRMVAQAPRSAPSAIGDHGQDQKHVSTPSPDCEPPTTFPDIENYDPTYGLRPDDLPAKSGYSGFGRLFGASRGLADLTEEPVDDSDETAWNEADSFDMVDWEDTVSFAPPPPSIASEDPPEYETIPAVGGGTVTRPRIFHSQSNIRSPVSSGSTPTIPLGHQLPNSGNDRWDLGTLTRVTTPNNIQNTFFPSWPHRPGTRRGQSISGLTKNMMSSLSAGSGPGINMLLRSSQRSKSSDNGFLASSFRGAGSYSDRMVAQQPLVTLPSDDSSVGGMKPTPSLDIRPRSLSTSTYHSLDGVTHGTTSNFRANMDTDGNIVLRPGVNNTISQLSTLSHSNHTLSPYTRSLEHFTVRSVPHRLTGPHLAADRQPTKARRKRTYHLGSKKPPDLPLEVSDPGEVLSSPPPPSEFEVSDVEHYFRVPHTNLRRRASYQTL